MTRISVLMPSYNPGVYGRNAIESLRGQLTEIDELVIQDGNSTDGWLESTDVLPESLVSVSIESDDGQADALNRALARARGDVIGWLNADDVYFGGALDAVRKAFDENPALEIVYGGYDLIDADGDVTRRTVPPVVSRKSLMLRGCQLFSGSFFIRRALLEKVGGFSKDLSYCMDYELYLRVWSENPTALRLEDELGALRIHGASKTSTLPWGFVKEARAVRRARASGLVERVLSEFETLKHAVTVATTPLRSSPVYTKFKMRGAGRQRA